MYSHTYPKGNVTFANSINETEVGTLWIDNLVLHPGSNLVNISAHMEQTRILSLLATRPYCEDGIIPFQMLGENVTNHGQNLSYFAAALGSNYQTVNIDIGAIVENTIGSSVDCED